MAQGFPLSPGQALETIITQLSVGEALVSTLDDKGFPTPGVQTLIAPPESRTFIQRSSMIGHYDTPIDRESAYEKLAQRRKDEV